MGHRDDAAGDEICLDDASYVLGSLTPADRQVFERHLAGCPRCQQSVQRLAGMPGLLALVGPEALEDPPLPGSPAAVGTGTGPVPQAAPHAAPPHLLPALLDEVAAQRRRRRWLVGSVSVLAAACAVALAVVLAVRPWAAGTGAGSTPVAQGEQVPLVQTTPGPLGVTVALDAKRWGTNVTVVCSYEGGTYDRDGYKLVFVDRQQRESVAASWMSTGGRATIPGSSDLQVSDIAEVRVLHDGAVILHGTP
ncbi:anti-sigma factor family protein [Nakamurella endophytica]